MQRHGKAVEPFLAEGETEEDTKVFLPEDEEDVKAEAKSEGEKKAPKTQESSTPGKAPTKPLSEALSEETQAAARLPGDTWIGGDESAMENASFEEDGPVQKSTDTKPDEKPTNTNDGEISALRDGPLNEVLLMDPPADLSIPHLHPPPYVHNFDSYTLVKEVEKGGYTPEQAITSMKAVRMLLAENLEVAKEGLVSKSDVENVRSIININPILIKSNADRMLHRSLISSKQHVPSSAPRFRTLAELATRKCGKNEPFCNTKSTSSTRN